MIDLRKGHPKPKNMPREQMAEACRRAADRINTLPLQYPTSAAGTQPFLKRLAEFLRESYGRPIWNKDLHGGGKRRLSENIEESPCFEDGLLVTNGV